MRILKVSKIDQSANTEYWRDCEYRIEIGRVVISYGKGNKYFVRKLFAKAFKTGKEYEDTVPLTYISHPVSAKQCAALDQLNNQEIKTRLQTAKYYFAMFYLNEYYPDIFQEVMFFMEAKSFEEIINKAEDLSLFTKEYFELVLNN